jgi:hypothetical protein
MKTFVIPGERAARGKGTQVVQHLDWSTAWVPFPSLRSAGDDSFVLGEANDR